MRIKNDELEKFRLRYLQTRKSEYKYGYKNRLFQGTESTELAEIASHILQIVTSLL